jgi:hypothetical protein
MHFQVVDFLCNCAFCDTLATAGNFIHRTTITSGHFRELSTALCCGQMKKARSGRQADFKWSSLCI